MTGTPQVQSIRMRAVQAAEPRAPFQPATKIVPGPSQVRVRVHACGVCAGDGLARYGAMGVKLPRVPGQEIAGTIDAVGSGVSAWKVGQRVGVGWHGGYCSRCDSCRAGDFTNCANTLITGLSFDGGYAEYTVVPQEALARIPDALS
ncbi:MAG TPA: alcohol dehydrogenase catalytic domain-containing protein [Terriglobales bacterium]|nr:alcohol dehydrogenase catalytic domain-containing protein [Terriglobales bacterium]